MAPDRADMDIDVIEPIMQGIVALANAMSEDWQNIQRAITANEPGIGQDRLARAFRTRYDGGTEKPTDFDPKSHDPGAAVTRNGASQAIADFGSSGNGGLAAVQVYAAADQAAANGFPR
ncbi:hypothetical protein [Amycolatopsis alba]|uniref:PE domain-containing protein n=1 Tax=Amycolatopsis alba DSM 44262 TaxID=1125972 RepID=A0A229RFR8_AMYAL|nr:hypothetical protein [Amycolatopsis alba]OXM45329.1 hypothetical protein CFP75_30695 [Amycolatopsis alba DSM 44262]